MPSENSLGTVGLDHDVMNYALGVEYQGTVYCGWQRQDGHAEISVQSLVEKALSRVADHPITVTCAGRTDSGVHACEQVVNFKTTAVRPSRAWILGVNSQLPRDIRILWVAPVTESFNSRFSATARTYRYVILNRPVPSAFVHHLLTWEKKPLNEIAMHKAAQYLLGEHDFTSYRSSSCQANTAFRFVESIEVVREQDLVSIEIKANAFLHHMVRNIAGVLLRVGRGEEPAVWAQQVLDVKDRRQAAETALPNGLYLLRVDYPYDVGLPQLKKSSTGPFESLLGGFF